MAIEENSHQYSEKHGSVCMCHGIHCNGWQQKKAMYDMNSCRHVNELISIHHGPISVLNGKRRRKLLISFLNMCCSGIPISK